MMDLENEGMEGEREVDELFLLFLEILFHLRRRHTSELA